MIETLLNDIRVGKVNCTNEDRLGAGTGFLVWLTANINGYNFGTYEDGRLRYDVMFKGDTIDDALQNALYFLRTGNKI